MIIKELKYLKPTKENHFAKIDKTIPSYPGLYLLFDEDLELIYLGKTKNIRRRILQHSSKLNSGRLEIVDKGSYYERNHTTCLPEGSVKYWCCIKIENEKERDLKELMLLGIFETRFNLTDKIEAIKKYIKDKQSKNQSQGEINQKEQ